MVDMRMYNFVPESDDEGATGFLALLLGGLLKPLFPVFMLCSADGVAVGSHVKPNLGEVHGNLVTMPELVYRMTVSSPKFNVIRARASNMRAI